MIRLVQKSVDIIFGAVASSFEGRPLFRRGGSNALLGCDGPKG